MADFIITNHAKERYCERIMGYDCKTTIAQFINEYGDNKIIEDINAMIQYGELIYSGIQTTIQKSTPNSIVDVYLKDLWVVITDKAKKTVITLYKIDLGAGDEVDKLFVSRLKENLAEASNELEAIRENAKRIIEENRNRISDNDSTAADYRKRAKNLDEQSEILRSQTKLENNNVELAEANVRDILAKLIGKKTF